MVNNVNKYISNIGNHSFIAMDFLKEIKMNISSISKAIAGAAVTALVGFLADKNVVLGNEVSDALNVVLAGLIGFIFVYFAPKNKPKPE